MAFQRLLYLAYFVAIEHFSDLLFSVVVVVYCPFYEGMEWSGGL